MQSHKLCKRDGGARGGVSLPDDIIFEVLLRQPLPPKTLHRFQSVCKGWRALLSDQTFLAERQSRASADSLIVAMFGTEPEEFELRLLDMDGNVLKVFDVRGGKAALLAPTRLDRIFVDRMELGAMVIDPASGRDFTVVGTDDPPQRQSWWEWDYSFGRAVPSGDYKILRLHAMETLSRSDGRHRSQWCEVGTIMDNGAEPTWRRRPGPFSQTSFSCKHKAAVDGNLYFMLRDTYSATHGRNSIATFNLENEEWKAKTIRGPLLGRKNEYDKWHITLTDLKGTLCMVQNVQHFGSHYANIWLLKDPNWSIWVKEYKIEMPERLRTTKPLVVLLDGRILHLNMFQKKAGNNEKCHRYILQFSDSSTKAFTDFMEMAERFNGRMAFYNGSLQC